MHEAVLPVHHAERLHAQLLKRRSELRIADTRCAEGIHAHEAQLHRRGAGDLSATLRNEADRLCPSHGSCTTCGGSTYQR